MEKYKSFALKGACLLILAALIYLFFKLVVSIILPFAIAFLIVALARPLINKLCAKRKISKSVATVLVVTLILILTILILSICVSLIFNELGSIVSKMLDNLESEDNFLSSLFKWLEGIRAKFPFLNSILPGINESIYSVALDMVSNGISSLSSALTTTVAKIITSLPSFIITLFILLLSLFYFAKDYDKITKAVTKLLPRNIAEKLPTVKREVVFVILKYVKSYAILLLITLLELFLGFLIIGIENSFTLALIIAIVDLLPILGVGTVLVPWSIIELVNGNTATGIGLLVLFAICYVLRQLLEPKILSKQMNVHPLITLFAMYTGLKLAGLTGLILASLITFIAKTVYVAFKKEKSVENSIKL